MSLFSLCLTYTLICQTRLTAPDPGRISQQARLHTDRTIFSHPESRHRPMQSCTLICLPPPSPSLSLFASLSFFMSFPRLPLSISVTFPLSLLPLPFISVLARPPSGHFCFITVALLSISFPLLCVPLFPYHIPNFIFLSFCLLILPCVCLVCFLPGPHFSNFSHFCVLVQHYAHQFFYLYNSPFPSLPHLSLFFSLPQPVKVFYSHSLVNSNLFSFLPTLPTFSFSLMEAGPRC